MTMRQQSPVSSGDLRCSDGDGPIPKMGTRVPVLGNTDKQGAAATAARISSRRRSRPGA